MTIPQSATSGLRHFHAGGVEEAEAPDYVRLVGDQVVRAWALAAEERDAHDLGPTGGDELGPEPDASLRRLHPDRVAVRDAELLGRLPVHLDPSLPGGPDEHGGLLEEPGLVAPAADRSRHQAIGDEAEREVPALLAGRQIGRA